METCSTLAFEEREQTDRTNNIGDSAGQLNASISGKLKSVQKQKRENQSYEARDLYQ